MRGGWSTPCSGRFTTGERHPYPFYNRLGGWAPGPVWTAAENPTPLVWHAFRRQKSCTQSDGVLTNNAALYCLVLLRHSKKLLHYVTQLEIATTAFMKTQVFCLVMQCHWVCSFRRFESNTMLGDMADCSHKKGNITFYST
jgi:hypothetical protein